MRKYLFLVCFLLSVSYKVYSSCESSFAKTQEAFSKNKGTQVFAAYVFKYYQEQGMSLPTGWVKNIIRDTSYWPDDLARMFLLFLESRIGRESTVQKIIKTSYLYGLNYNSFKKRVDFYDHHIGKDAVNNLLNRSLSGFYNGDIKEVVKTIEFFKHILKKQRLKH